MPLEAAENENNQDRCFCAFTRISDEEVEREPVLHLVALVRKCSSHAHE